MGYLFLFVVFIVVNIIIYLNAGIAGFLIYNFAVISISLVMIYDKIGKRSYDMNRMKEIFEEQKLKQPMNASEEGNTPQQKEDI